jgi:hypothetical protein
LLQMIQNTSKTEKWLRVNKTESLLHPETKR